jgi:hypothetical protein
VDDDQSRQWVRSTGRRAGFHLIRCRPARFVAWCMPGWQEGNITTAPQAELSIGVLPEPPSEAASAVFRTHMLDGSQLIRLFTNPTDSKNNAFLEE